MNLSLRLLALVATIAVLVTLHVASRPTENVREKDDGVAPMTPPDRAAPQQVATSINTKCDDQYNMHSYGYGDETWARREYLRGNDLTGSCKTQSSNPHGSYTSLGQCVFKFHKIEDDNVKDNYMSSACSDANIVEEHQHDAKDDPIRMEVVGWPDACVGDFVRCYKVDRDEHILLQHVCKKHLSVPAAATHISVDCTEDKEQQKIKANSTDGETASDWDPLVHHQKKARRELYAFIAIMAIVGFLFVCGCLAALHRYAFRPYLKALKNTRPDPAFQPYLKALKRTRSDPEMAGLTCPE
jgi:hypothetical protein